MKLHRDLGISYNSAWRMKHKLMQVMMERDNDKKLSGVIELDDAYLGGEHFGGKRGRGDQPIKTFCSGGGGDKRSYPRQTQAFGSKRISITGNQVM